MHNTTAAMDPVSASAYFEPRSRTPSAAGSHHVPEADGSATAAPPAPAAPHEADGSATAVYIHIAPPAPPAPHEADVDTALESLRRFCGHDIVDTALESLSIFWQLRNHQDIPRNCMRLFINVRLPLHQRLPMPIVLRVMKYIEKCRSHVVVRTMAAIRKIHLAIDCMVQLHGDQYYNFNYDLSLRLCKVKLQEYIATEPLAARSSGDVLGLLSAVANDICPPPLSPPHTRMRMHCFSEAFKEAVCKVRDLLVEQIRAMMSGSTKVFFSF